jgi:hypothetical protein
MLTSAECDQVAEDVIIAYCTNSSVQTPDELRKALELLGSKAARAIEKYCGKEEAINVLRRTICHLQGGTVQ